jgi:hypothetical protein
MARKWILAGIVVFVVAGGLFVAVVLPSIDDGGTTSRSAPSSTRPSEATTGAEPSTTVTPPSSTNPLPTTTTSSPPAVLPGPCGIDAGPITAAVDAGVAGARTNATLTDCRHAAVDTSWVLVHLEAKPGTQFAPTSVLLHGGGGSWTIVDSGSNQVGCGKAPQQVLVDLGLLCVGSGGAT